MTALNIKYTLFTGCATQVIYFMKSKWYRFQTMLNLPFWRYACCISGIFWQLHPPPPKKKKPKQTNKPKPQTCLCNHMLIYIKVRLFVSFFVCVCVWMIEIEYDLNIFTYLDIKWFINHSKNFLYQSQGQHSELSPWKGRPKT